MYLCNLLKRFRIYGTNKNFEGSNCENKSLVYLVNDNELSCSIGSLPMDQKLQILLTGNCENKSLVNLVDNKELICSIGSLPVINESEASNTFDWVEKAL